jgi:hypothetical protein
MNTMCDLTFVRHLARRSSLRLFKLMKHSVYTVCCLAVSACSSKSEITCSYKDVWAEAPSLDSSKDEITFHIRADRNNSKIADQCQPLIVREKNRVYLLKTAVAHNLFYAVVDAKKWTDVELTELITKKSLLDQMPKPKERFLGIKWVIMQDLGAGVKVDYPSINALVDDSLNERREK